MSHAYLESSSSDSEQMFSFGADLALSPEDVRACFGAMWCVPGRAPPDPKLCDEEYKQCLNRNVRYDGITNEIISKIMTGAMKNAKNLWVLTVMMPSFTTSQKHWFTKHREWNALPWTQKQEGGTENQPTYSEWDTEDNMGPKVSQSVTISVDLARDPNFGLQTWLENLSELNKNLANTLMRACIEEVRDIAYCNMTRDHEGVFSAERLFAQEAFSTFICANDPNAFYDLLRKMTSEHDGLRLCVMPQLGMRFTRDMSASGSPQPMEAMTLAYNAGARRLEKRARPSVMSTASYRMASGEWLHMKEVSNMVVNSKDKTPWAPLSTVMTVAQFFEPNTRLGADDRITSTQAGSLDMWITHQTKTRVEIRKLRFRDLLRNCFFFDAKTGKVSKYVLAYCAQLNSEKQLDGPPAQWRQGSTNVNDDDGDYDVPDQEAKRHVGSLTAMKTFRALSIVAVWDAAQRLYRPAALLGDFLKSQLPHRWVMPAVHSLALRFHEETGLHAATAFAKLKTLRNNIMRTPITAAYLRELINANMLAIVRNGARTDNGLREFQPDANGSLRLPSNREGGLTGMKYLPFFWSGAALLSVRDYQLGPESQFYEFWLETREALAPVDLMIDFLRKYLPGTEVVDPKRAKSWFLEKNAHQTFIDTAFPGGVPVFLGEPTAATFGEGTAAQPSKVFSDRLVTLLTGTSAAKRASVADVTTGDLIAAIEAGAVVDASIEALACLNFRVADAVKKDLLLVGTGRIGDSARDQAYRAAVDKLCKFVLTTCGWPKISDNQETNRRIVSAVAAQFFAVLKTAEGLGEDQALATIAQAQEYVTKLMTARGFKAEQAGLVASDAYKMDDGALADQLLVAVDTASRSSATLANRSAAQRRTDAETRATTAPSVDYFEGAYAAPPTRYLRSPLYASPKLLEFIRETGNAWALPADPLSNYTSPDFRALERTTSVKRENKTVDLQAQLVGFEGRLAALSSATPQEDDEQQGGYTPKSTALDRRHRKPTAAGLFSFGAAAADLDDEDAYPRAECAPKSSGGGGAEQVMRDHYFGPWEYRMSEVACIADDWERVLATALYLAPNELAVHLGLADCDASVINVVPVRPFVKYQVSSPLLMGYGPDVLGKPMTPVDVDISKNRDSFEVKAAIEHGCIGVGTDKIHMLYGAIPEEYLGGKNLDFITAPAQYAEPDPNKPGIVAMPTPKGETNYEGTIHLLNRATTRVVRRQDKPQPLAKWSAAGFFESVFTRDAVQTIESRHAERTHYKNPTPVAHVAHKGPRIIFDPNTRQEVKLQGFGPANSSRMNEPGAEAVFLQVVDTFAQAQRAQVY